MTLVALTSMINGGAGRKCGQYVGFDLNFLFYIDLSSEGELNLLAYQCPSAHPAVIIHGPTRSCLLHNLSFQSLFRDELLLQLCIFI